MGRSPESQAEARNARLGATGFHLRLSKASAAVVIAIAIAWIARDQASEPGRPGTLSGRQSAESRGAVDEWITPDLIRVTTNEQEEDSMSDDLIDAEVVKAILREQGWVPSEDADGDVLFRNQGFSHVLLPHPSDDEFMAILVPNLFRPSSLFERDIALDEASRVNREFKLGKAYLAGSPEALHITYEFLAHDRESLERSIGRGCDMLPMLAGDIRNAIRLRIASVEGKNAG